MKLNIKFQNDWFIVPVHCTNKNIDWLIVETIKRYLCFLNEKKKKFKTNSDRVAHNGQTVAQTNGHLTNGNGYNEDQFNQLYKNVIEIRKNSINAILSKTDLIQEVLDDDDFLCIGNVF